MKRYLKKMISLCLVLLLVGTLLPLDAQAVQDDLFEVTEYSVISPKSITKKTTSAKVNVKLYSSYEIAEDTEVKAIFRANESFSKGNVETKRNNNEEYLLTFTDLTYTGVGNELSFRVSADGEKQDFSIALAACVPYEKPIETPDPVEPVETELAPRALFSYEMLNHPLEKNEAANICLNIKNIGSVTMEAPLVILTLPEEMILTGGSDNFGIASIRPGRTETLTIPIQMLSKITSEKQTIGISMQFNYDDNSKMVNETAEGKIVLPAKLTDEPEEEEEPEKIANPVPLIILSGYSYGGSSVAAGAETSLSFTFRNTSKTAAIENVMLSVSSGADLTINGSTNTFYFDVIPAGGTKSVTIPLKAVQRISSSAENVGLSFSYEYVDQDRRNSNSSDLSVSIPLYQPDRFEISDPVAAYVGFVGEETSLTMDYVNKGKTEVCNVEARIEGDVDCFNNFVRVGNLESGKSGTIAFAVTPMLEGNNQVRITVSYEDTNGDVKERVFETTLSAMAQELFDPGEWEEPIGPVEEENGFPWQILVLAALILLIIILIVMKKKKKKAKLAAEQALWDDWDDEAGAKKTDAEAEVVAVTEETAK